MTSATTEAKIFSITQSKALAEKIASAYGTKLGKVITSTYSDGEFQPSFEESVRGRRVFKIGSTHPSSKNLMEMLLMLWSCMMLIIIDKYLKHFLNLWSGIMYLCQF